MAACTTDTTETGAGRRFADEQRGDGEYQKEGILAKGVYQERVKPEGPTRKGEVPRRFTRSNEFTPNLQELRGGRAVTRKL